MSKTYLDDLLDKYPHCMILKPGYPRICRGVLYEGKYCDGSYGYDCCNCWHEEMQEDAPAVPQEMTAKEYIATLNRMCGIHYVDCEKCPLETENNGQGKPCSILQKENPEVSIAIVEKWAREHPEKVNDG